MSSLSKCHTLEHANRHRKKNTYDRRPRLFVSLVFLPLRISFPRLSFPRRVSQVLLRLPGYSLLGSFHDQCRTLEFPPATNLEMNQQTDRRNQAIWGKTKQGLVWRSKDMKLSFLHCTHDRTVLILRVGTAITALRTGIRRATAKAVVFIMFGLINTLIWKKGNVWK